MKGSTVALILGGIYLASRPGGMSGLTNVLNPAGQQPKASQQASSSGAKGTGAPAGAGSSSSAGRGGTAKSGGGAQTGSLEQVFGTFDNLHSDSLVASDVLFNEFSDENVAPDLSFFEGQTPGDISGITNSFTSGPAPAFGGDQSLIDPETGLVINPDTGLPFGQEEEPGDVVDLTSQVNADSSILPPDVEPDFTDFFD